MYFEQQAKLFCGIHAINNVLGDRIVDDKAMKRACEQMLKTVSIHEDEKDIKDFVSSSGDYDVSVLIFWLHSHGYHVEMIHDVQGRYPASSNTIGFIFNHGVHGNNHYTCLKRARPGVYVAMDSMKCSPGPYYHSFRHYIQNHPNMNIALHIRYQNNAFLID